MTWFESTVLTRVAIPAALVLAVQVSITQVQRDLGMPAFSAAHAQKDAKKPERETRRTPALRNKVYEKLSEAQAAAREATSALERERERHSATLTQSEQSKAAERVQRQSAAEQAAALAETVAAHSKQARDRDLEAVRTQQP